MTEYPDVTFTRLFTSVSPEQIQNLEVKAPNHVSTSLLNYYILQNQNSGYEEEIVDKLKGIFFNRRCVYEETRENNAT